jgi:hypothetical protein
VKTSGRFLAGCYSHAQRFGNNLKCGGQFPWKFAIDFQSDFFIAIRWSHNYFARQGVADFRHREMRTEVNSRRTGEEFQGIQIAHANDVELAVSEFRIRSDLHAAAEVTRICNAEV